MLLAVHEVFFSICTDNAQGETVVVGYIGAIALVAVGMLVVTALAALLTGFASLELIASCSSMTFLLVSIGVCVANLRLRRVTHAALAPVLLGIVLMTVTVTLLVVYLAANDPRTLLFCCGIYGVVCVAHLIFERVAGRAGSPR